MHDMEHSTMHMERSQPMGAWKLDNTLRSLPNQAIDPNMASRPAIVDDTNTMPL